MTNSSGPRLFLTALALTIFATAQADARPPATQKPNILFIAVDGLNDWVGCLGGSPGEVHTPNLDRLAARGMVFANAHAPSSAGHPSRLAVMTGIRPSNSGIVANVREPSLAWRESPVLRDAATLSQHFRDHGYRAVGCGEIYHASQARGANDPSTWDDYFSNADAADLSVVDWAIRKMNQPRERPLFLAVGIARSTPTGQVPQKYLDLYPLDEIVLPASDPRDLADAWNGARDQSAPRNRRQRKQAVRDYLAGVSFADAQLGRLLDGFDRSLLKGDTIIVLWSDHGLHLGEKGRWGAETLWEESTRVPLVFIVPGITPPGGRCDRAVSLLDIYPTLAELTHTATGRLEGESLAARLGGADFFREQPAVTTFRGHHAVRADDWRYIRYDTGLEELYNHQSDPRERTNLAYDPAMGEVLEYLRGEVQRFTGVAPPEPGFVPEGYRVTDGRIEKMTNDE